MRFGPMLSRRQFFRRAGSFVALAGLPLIEGHSQPNPRPSPLDSAALAARAAQAAQRAAIAGTSLGLPDPLDPTPLAGRALHPLDLRARPDPAAPSVGQLQPQSVSVISGLSLDGWWYAILNGYAPREQVQPILPYARPAPSDANGDESHGGHHGDSSYRGYYEVIAPVTRVRQYCAGHAPIIAHVGYGATLYVHDRLTDDHRQTWYAVTGSESGQGFYGWVSSLHLRRWSPDALLPVIEDDLTVWIDPARCKLSVYDGERLVGESALYAGPLPSCAATLHPDAPGAWVMRTPFIRPWLMQLRREVGPILQVYGAFWHNRFGMPCSGPHLELPIFAARWLYHALLRSPHRRAAVIIE